MNIVSQVVYFKGPQKAVIILIVRKFLWTVLILTMAIDEGMSLWELA